MKRWRSMCGAMASAALMMASAGPVCAQVIMKDVPPEMQGIAQEDRLGQSVPMDIEVLNWDGKSVALGEYFQDEKPVVLALVYYSCPMMCPLVLGRLQERINDLPYIAGEDYKLVVVSFDTTEKPEQAAGARGAFLAGYRIKANAVIESGLLFHTARPEQIHRLADAVGFKYKFVPETNQYAHGSALTVITGAGKVSRYVDGLSSDKNELRLALLEATEGKIAQSIGDLFLHFCYRWDPKTGAYTMQAMRVMQIGAMLTALGVATLIVGLRAGERLRAARRAGGDAPATPARGATVSMGSMT